MIEGLLKYANEQRAKPHLQLGDEWLVSRCPLEICVQGHWIAGHVAFGTFGEGPFLMDSWYLHLSGKEEPVILLKPGLRARIRQGEMSFQ